MHGFALLDALGLRPETLMYDQSLTNQLPSGLARSRLKRS